MSCPDDYDFDDLYRAADKTQDKVSVPKVALAVLVDCYMSGRQEDGRAKVYELHIEGKGNKQTVDRAALFALLMSHADMHRDDWTPRAQPDPSCSCAVCTKLRNGKPAPIKSVATPIGQKAAAVRASVSNSDDLALAIKEFFADDPITKFDRLCKDNGINPTKYAGRGFGLQRMALGNELRNRMKRGDAIKVGARSLSST